MSYGLECRLSLDSVTLSETGDGFGSIIQKYDQLVETLRVHDHVFFSQTRAWMAVVMGAVMAAIMLGFMLKMYKSTNLNLAIFGGSVVAFAIALGLVRSQQTVDDVSYMSAMIPHHSIAIMTSRRAHIRDPRVRKLADGIIEAQVREISEMKQLIADIEQHPIASNAPDLRPKDKPAQMSQ